MIYLCFSLEVISDNFVLALNEQYILPDQLNKITLKAGDELAIIPPLSGG